MDRGFFIWNEGRGGNVMAMLQGETTMVVRELDGDVFTPISIFQRIQGTKKFLYESSLKHKDAGRYSFVGANPVFELLGYDTYSLRVDKNGTKKRVQQPLAYMKELLSHQRWNGVQLPFIGGAVGYIGYDAMKEHYRITKNQQDELKLPNAHLQFYEQMIAFDHFKQKVYVIGIPLLESTTLETLKVKVQQMVDQLKGDGPVGFHPDTFSVATFKPSQTKEQFIDHVNIAKKYIQAGTVDQVVLSQRLSATFEGNPFSFYRKLRLSNPSPYMFYIDFQDYTIAGSSPESLVKVVDDSVATNPIAGTRPRGETKVEDEVLERELLKDKKEIAEHNMLVALSKQELTTICEAESIKTEKYLQIEKFKHVMHLVSVLSGKLTDGRDAVDALTACLPAGTVSGTPKGKAMEIINELETSKRGAYAGAVGYFSANGNCDFALAIRMMVLKNNVAYVQAGAGIVADSVPHLEYEETLHKLKALLKVEG